MSDYSHLLQVIRMRVCESRKLSHTAYSKDSLQDNQIRNRTALIFILELVLDQHRAQHGSIFTPLQGKDALHHLIFVKTKWLPSEIRKLNFQDALFVIQDELKKENIPEEAQELLKAFYLPSVAITFDDFLEQEWDYKENSVFLQNQRLKASQ